MTGWDEEDVKRHLTDHIEPSLRKRIILVACAGSEIWMFDDDGKLEPRPRYYPKGIISKASLNIAQEIMEEVRKIYLLDEPILDMRGKSIDEAVQYSNRKYILGFELDNRK